MWGLNTWPWPPQWVFWEYCDKRQGLLSLLVTIAVRFPLHYTWSEDSFLHLLAPDAPNQLLSWRSQDQPHGTAAQAERHRRGVCFPSMINAVRSSADAAQDFKDQRASSSVRAASTRRKFSASLQGPAGFFFTSSLDRTQVLPTVPQQEVGVADGLKKRRMCSCRTLCETCVDDSLRPASMRYLQVEQRVSGARYMCAV